MSTTLFVNLRWFRRSMLLAMACAVQITWAQEPLSLPQAQSLAVGRALQLTAQNAVISATREMAVAAGQLPDPVLKFGVENLPITGPDTFNFTRDFMTMRRIGIAQDFPREEKRKLKTERLEHDSERLVAQRRTTLAAVQRDTALAWLDRHYALAMRGLLVQQQQETALQAQAAETAFRSGRGSQADVFVARAALGLLADRMSQIDRQSRSAALQLERWIGPAAARLPAGVPPWQSSVLAAELFPEAPHGHPDSPFDRHLQSHPQVAALAAQLQAAQVDSSLAEANKSADWSVEASFSQRGPDFSNMISLVFSVPIQWDRAKRQDRELAAKVAMVAEAQALYDDMLRSRETELRTLHNDWQNGKERVAHYVAQLLPLARLRSEAALAVYRSAKGDLASVLAARRDEIEVRLQAIAVEAETARLWAQLEFSVPDPTVEAQQ